MSAVGAPPLHRARRLAVRLAVMVGLMAVMRLAWIPIGPGYFRGVVGLARPLSMAGWGVGIGTPAFENGIIRVQVWTDRGTREMRWESEYAVYLALNLFVFVGLVAGLSSWPVRVRRRGALAFLLGLAVLAATHGAVLLAQVVAAASPGPPGHEMRWLGSMMMGSAPFVPFLLWGILFAGPIGGLRPAAPRARGASRASTRSAAHAHRFR